MITTVIEQVSSTQWRERVLWEQSSPDRVKWGVPLYLVGEEHEDEAGRMAGLWPVEYDECSFRVWMAPPCWRTYLMMVWVLLKPIGWWFLRTFWQAGLIEAPPEARIGPIRFRPFPWLGSQRRYRP